MTPDYYGFFLLLGELLMATAIIVLWCCMLGELNRRRELITEQVETLQSTQNLYMDHEYRINMLIQDVNGLRRGLSPSMAPVVATEAVPVTLASNDETNENEQQPLAPEGVFKSHQP